MGGRLTCGRPEGSAEVPSGGRFARAGGGGAGGEPGAGPGPPQRGDSPVSVSLSPRPREELGPGRSACSPAVSERPPPRLVSRPSVQRGGRPVAVGDAASAVTSSCPRHGL